MKFLLIQIRNLKKMKSFVLLVMISYFMQFTVVNGAEPSVVQYPQDINVSLNSSILILCEFDYPDKTTVDTEVYWRKGPNCKQPGLHPSTSTSQVQKSKLRIETEESKRFSILQLDNIQLDDSGIYFCDLSLIDPPPVRRKCGSGSRVTVHESKCNSNIRHEKRSWVWFFLLGYSICSSIILMSVCVLQYRKKCRPMARNAEDICTLPSEWLYDKPSRTVNNNQEYEDMTSVRTFTHNGSIMYKIRMPALLDKNNVIYIV